MDRVFIKTTVGYTALILMGRQRFSVSLPRTFLITISNRHRPLVHSVLCFVVCTCILVSKTLIIILNDLGRWELYDFEGVDRHSTSCFSFSDID